MTIIEKKFGFAGHYKMEALREDFSVREMLEFDNLITDQGLDFIGGPPNSNTPYGEPMLCTHCEVGTGNAVPAFTDTGCAAPLAMFPTSTGSNAVSGAVVNVAGPPSYWSTTWVYTFAQGAAAGNLTEVVTGNTNSGDTHVRAFSRALILDGNGQPTTLVVQPTEYLKVTYELRLYYDASDTAVSFNIAGVPYTGVLRRAQTGNNPFFYDAFKGDPFNKMSMSVFAGALGLTTGKPASQIGGAAFASSAAYVAGTHRLDFTAFFDIGDGNGTISAVMFIGAHGQWQYSVVPAYVKTNTQQLTLGFRCSWGRYAP